MKKTLLLLLMCVASLIADEPRKGTICFDKDCAPATGAKFDVKPADADRRFVWMTSDATNVVIGTLPAKATSVDLETKDAHDVTLTMRGDAIETKFSIAEGRDRGWKWLLPAKSIGKPLTIRVPRGAFAMFIGAEHHKTDRRPLTIKDADVPLNNITLAPLPVIAGRIVTTKKDADVPVAGAQLMANGSKVITATNEQGAFRAELPEPEPQEITIVAPGFATLALPLSIHANETDLGTIRLAGGLKLAAHIDRPYSLKSMTLLARLTAKSKTQYENTNIAMRQLKAGDDDVTFADLAEGEYYLTLSGDTPLQKLTTVIDIKDHDVSKEIRIAPFEVQGSVRVGTEPVRDGKVGINDRHHTWSADVTIDGEGHFGGTMWQRDQIGGWVQSAMTGTLSVEAVELQGDPAHWDIAFRRRLITGRLFDAQTNQPVERATLSLQLEVREPPPSGGGSKMSQMYTSVPVASDGTYSIIAVHDGVYDLNAHASDYVDAKSTVEMKADDESKSLDFPLSHGVDQSIEFVSWNGQPVARAMVLEGVARDGHNPAWYTQTDATGTAHVRMQPGESKTLFIAPRDGSFAGAHVIAPAAGAEAKPMRVTVPQPVGALTIHFVDRDGNKVQVRPAIRFNGEWLPYSLIGRLRFALLPAGVYEIWGVRRDESGLVPPPREPVRVGLSGGEQTVDVVVP